MKEFSDNQKEEITGFLQDLITEEIAPNERYLEKVEEALEKADFSEVKTEKVCVPINLDNFSTDKVEINLKTGEKKFYRTFHKSDKDLYERNGYGKIIGKCVKPRAYFIGNEDEQNT